MRGGATTHKARRNQDVLTNAAIHVLQWQANNPDIRYLWDIFVISRHISGMVLAMNGRTLHYTDVIMTTMASQITSLTIVYSTVYSDADQRKHQSSASLAFVWGIHRDRWIPRTKGQLRGKCFHLMTSSWHRRAQLVISVLRRIRDIAEDSTWTNSSSIDNWIVIWSYHYLQVQFVLRFISVRWSTWERLH